MYDILIINQRVKPSSRLPRGTDRQTEEKAKAESLSGFFGYYSLDETFFFKYDIIIYHIFAYCPTYSADGSFFKTAFFNERINNGI